MSKHPVFLGDPKQQVLTDPQSLNSYSYANDNPISRSDPNGKAASLSGVLSALSSVLRSLLSILSGGGGGAASGGSGGQSGPNSAASNKGPTAYTSVSLPGGYVQQKTATGCFDACADMVGYTPDSRHRIVTSNFNSNGQLVPQVGAQQGVQTIDTYLANGQPITVGININGGTEPLNTGHEQTQHYVVIDGSGSDAGGKYFHFVDPFSSSHSVSPDNKLYLNSDNSLSGKSTYGTGKAFVATEVRPK